MSPEEVGTIFLLACAVGLIVLVAAYTLAGLTILGSAVEQWLRERRKE